MASFGMKLTTTRVFGMAPRDDTVRVLRSGRKEKVRKNVDEKMKREVAMDDSDDDISLMEMMKRIRKTRSQVSGTIGFYPKVYTRKRKRTAEDAAATTGNNKKMNNQCLLTFVVKPFRDSSDIFLGFFILLLRYITRFRCTLREISAFVLSEPISSVYASRGIQFLQGSVTTTNAGICEFFEIKRFLPMLRVDFSAVPLYFKSMHSAMFLRSMYRSLILLYNPVDAADGVEDEIDFPKIQIELHISSDTTAESKTIIVPEVVESNNSSSKNGQQRTTKNSRRTSCKKRKGRKPSLVNKSNNGALASDPKRRQRRKTIDCEIPAPVRVARVILVPGVQLVSDYAESFSVVPFERPRTYIYESDDELYRAMTKKTANYDMDSEDEEWLSKFNSEFQGHNNVSDENFELIIDALEKAFYSNPDGEDGLDEKFVTSWCESLGSKEVVDAVYSYWMRKREQKHASLLRVFQGHPQKKALPIPKPLMRKKRSLRGREGPLSRSLCPIAWKGIVSFKENAEREVIAAKVNANEWKEFAFRKRKGAQFLLKNADLATYRALKLMTIAEIKQPKQKAS